MGVVYLAEDTRLGRLVALKSLPSALSLQSDLRQRLRREARAAATISHPAVAVVYALEEVNDLFIASEIPCAARHCETRSRAVRSLRSRSRDCHRDCRSAGRGARRRRDPS